MRFVATLLCLIALIGFAAAAGAAGARLYKSGPIQISADGAVVWMANPDNDSVTRLDTATEQVLEVPLPDPGIGHLPRGVAVSDDGAEVWVACQDSDRVYVLSGVDGSELARIDLPWGTGPYSVVLTPPVASLAGGSVHTHALVTGFRGGRLVLLDVAARGIAKLLEPVYRSPFGVTFADDGSAWVTHLFADGEHPRITRVDFSDPADPQVTIRNRVFAVQPQNSFGTAPRRAEGGYVTLRGHPAQVPAGQDQGRVWLPVQYQNIHENDPHPDSTLQSTVRKVDLAAQDLVSGSNFADNPGHPAKVILTAVDVHDPVNGQTYDGPGWNAQVAGAVDVAFSADGTTAWLLHEHSEDVVVLPTDTPPVKPQAAPTLIEIAVGRRPMGIVASPAADRAYVLNVLSRTVSVLDLATASELRQIAVTPVTGEPFDALRLRGAEIFYSSNEDAISLHRKAACASCHLNGEHDGRIWDLEHLPGNHGPRHTQNLAGLGATFGPVDPATGWGQLHRSGDRDEVQDFEHTFQGLQMGGLGFLGGAVHPELGTPNAGASADLDALADFVLSIPAVPRSPYRDEGGFLTKAAVRGATFFKGSNPAKPADAQCATCHLPATGFVDFAFHDVGQMVLPGENELDQRTPVNHVNTASLVGLWTTPPYEGVTTYAAETVAGLLRDFRDRPGAAPSHGRVDQLTGRQLRDLEEFLLSIDGDLTATDVTAAADLEPPRLTRVAPTSRTRLEVWLDESVDPSSAENVAAWSLVEVGTGQPRQVLSASLDPRNGDRVTLVVEEMACDQASYELSVAGPIPDLADTATGGVANVLTDSEPLFFTVGPVLTLTLGGSGYENLDVEVHDAADLPGLTTWSHGSAWFFPVGGGASSTAFVRFDWESAFQAATGVTSSADLVSARVVLRPGFGGAQTVEARRVLQPWFDHRGSDWNSNPVDPDSGRGGPTWNQSEHGVADWNSPNAGARTAGVEGTSVADYGGADDTAFTPDASIAMTAINEPLVLSGGKVGDAFRFWFDNPAVDYGYALRLAPGSMHEVRFDRVEQDFMDRGPVLEITYRLSGGCGVVFADGFESGDTSAWSP